MIMLLVVILLAILTFTYSHPSDSDSLPRDINVCTSDHRLAAAAAIPAAYASNPISTTLADFQAVGFSDDCVITIAANGAPPVPVAISGSTTVTFGTATRQLFSKVTGEYTDFPANNSALITTNVTLGINVIPLPITFHAYVYLDFNNACEIKAVRAIAAIPTSVLGLILNPPSLPPLRRDTEVCTGPQRKLAAYRIPFSYSLPEPASAASFHTVPFADDAKTYMSANGSPLITVATDKIATVNYAIATRGIFSKVTFDYSDDAANNVGIIHTQVTIAKGADVPDPVTFSTDVYLDFNGACEIENVRAYATIDPAVISLVLHPSTA